MAKVFLGNSQTRSTKATFGTNLRYTEISVKVEVRARLPHNSSNIASPSYHARPFYTTKLDASKLLGRIRAEAWLS